MDNNKPKKWSEEEENKLIETINNSKSIRQGCIKFAKESNRTKHSVVGRWDKLKFMDKFNLGEHRELPKGTVKVWTKEEIKILMFNKNLSSRNSQYFEEVSKKIGRTVEACRLRYYTLIEPENKNRVVKIWTKEEEQLVLETAEKYTNKSEGFTKLAKQLDRSVKSCFSRYYVLKPVSERQTILN